MGTALLARLLAGREDAGSVTHVEQVPARAGRTTDWPAWTPPLLIARLAARGIAAPWTHQRQTAELARAGRSVVVATGTASGKSLAYQLPALSALLEDERATALYLAPTKALAADQLRAVRALALTSVRAATYDGDTPREEREWVRAHARLVLTNPDMLHAGILPSHPRWSATLRRLRYVVVDECHTYRGVFGSHVAHVLRRLRRICARYGAEPVFVLASATSADPASSASRLVGLPVRAVLDDGSPHSATTFALWEPPLTSFAGENGAPVRRAATTEAADLLADLVACKARSLTFVRSRRGAEVVALAARRALLEVAPALAGRVAAYRAGYLAEDRRALEHALLDGSLLGVAATNALELGVDISGLDAVVLVGYPGTIASVWQQAGRAGRSGQDALAIFVARDDPLDTYLVHHPGAIFGRPVEATVLDPDNEHVLGPQLTCAAAELPLTDADAQLFGAGSRAVLADLVRRGVLRHRPSGWYWTSRDRPRVDIRGTGGDPVGVVERDTGRLLGTVDAGAAHSAVHDGAVYLHQGASYVVDRLDLLDNAAIVHAEEPDWTTQSRDVTDLRIVRTQRRQRLGAIELCYGTVDVTSQVVSYLRRRPGTGEVIDETPLDLPVRELGTRAVWYSLPADILEQAGISRADVPGATHAAEHAAIGLLPLVATCDRWDIGGVSTAWHPDTERPTVFVYDGHPGGAGFAARGYDAMRTWLAATRTAITSCECDRGCPSCLQSPKCGNGNEPLDKAGPVRLLGVVVDAMDAGGGAMDAGGGAMDAGGGAMDAGAVVDAVDAGGGATDAGEGAGAGIDAIDGRTAS
ncbi:MAG: DEAD/DEAH box helicase [Mycobacteriales bacterium]